MKRLNQKLATTIAVLLLVITMISSCKKANTVTPDDVSNLTATIDGQNLAVTDQSLATTFYSSPGDNVNSLSTTATIDATSGTALNFFIPDISAGTITLSPKLGTSSNPGSPGLQIQTTSTSTTTVQAYVSYTTAGNTYYAISGTITTIYDGSKITVKWTITFKDATGRTFTSTGSFTIYHYTTVTQPKTQITDPTPVSAKPTIDNISPTSGAAGTEVAISGTNFSTTLTDNVVMFNGVAAVVKTATANKLTVNAPSAGTTGAITVKVKNSETTTGPVFTYVKPNTSTGQASILTTQLFGYNFKTYSNDGGLYVVDGDGRIVKISLTAGTSNKVYTVADISFTTLTTYVCKGLTRDANGGIHAYIIGSGGTTNANYTAYVISINPSSGVITKDFQTNLTDTAAIGFAMTAAGDALLLSSYYGSDDVVRLKTDGTTEVYLKGGTGTDNTLGGAGAYSISIAGPYVYILTYSKGVANINHAIYRFDANRVRTVIAAQLTTGYADGGLTAAKFSDIRCIEVNSTNGDIYVGDYGNLRIRKISLTTGTAVVTTVAGNGVTGTTYTGDILSINLLGTYGLLFDSLHNVLYNFPSGNVIQKLTFTI